MKIGIIGTGMLGNAVGENLIKEGFELIVYNRTKEKTKQIESKGAQIAQSPKIVAENSELVIIVLKDADVVKKISFGQDGIIHSNNKKVIVADMSTINPLESKEITKKFLEYGITKLDIPVMGGPNVAITGELVVMGSGNKVEFDKLKHVFEKIGNKVFYLGETGTAHFVKLAMNLQITMLALALSEGIMFVKGAKLDPKIFLEILNSTYFKTGMSENKAYKMIKGDFEPTFTLENLKKDISIINQTAHFLEIELPMIKKAEEVYHQAIEQGFGSIDYTGILEYLKKINEN